MATVKKTPAKKTPAKADKAESVATLTKPAKGTKAAKAEKAERAPKDIKNGQARPGPNAMVRKVWDIADKLSTPKSPATRAAVLLETAKVGIKASTTATQYGRWRKYTGIAGRAAAAE